MSIFDLFDPFQSRKSSSIFKLINEDPGPQRHPSPRSDAENIILKAVRDKVDEVIDPNTEVGEAIHKMRKKSDQVDDMLRNGENSYKNLFYGEFDAQDKKEYKLADHLFVRSGPITHHGIYVGNNEVIHYNMNPDGKIVIHRASLEDFSEGRKIYCMKESESPLKYSRHEAVRRATARLGEGRYNLMMNNCENFVRWYRSGGEQWVWEQE